METMIVRTAEAADLLATSPNRVLELIREGEIPAYRDGRNWSIPRTLLQAYVEDRAREETERRRNERSNVG